jgi:hypothetical protein
MVCTFHVSINRRVEREAGKRSSAVVAASDSPPPASTLLRVVVMAKEAVTILGLDQFERKIKSWAVKAVSEGAKGVREWGERTLAVTKDGGEGYSGPICPVKDGNLLSTGHVGKIEQSRGKATITIGYGGSAAPYALRVHEMSEGANWSKPGSGPGYLKQPVDHMQRKVIPILMPHVKRVFT